MALGARNTACRVAGVTAVSIHSSSAKPPCRALAGSACAIRSQAMAYSGQADIGVEASPQNLRTMLIGNNRAILRVALAQ